MLIKIFGPFLFGMGMGEVLFRSAIIIFAGVFIDTLAKKCPNLQILSMMNNEAAPSYFNSGTKQQYMDYR